MFLLNNNPLPLDTAFTAGGISYPANWLRLATPAERKAIGITEVPDQPRPDDRYYWVTQNADGSFTATPKDLSSLQANAVEQINETVWQMLLKTDFMDSRPNYTPPADWLAWREAVRVRATAAKAAVKSTKTVEELIALGSIDWPLDPNQPTVTADK